MPTAANALVKFPGEITDTYRTGVFPLPKDRYRDLRMKARTSILMARAARGLKSSVRVVLQGSGTRVPLLV
ncbi:hypothetical protein LWI29_018961 [Acer saccharum]|uniref:Uncharacterized protein n=1 Tax=Acer saccharum TaxID=4024 RepID=A0AA39VL70_ACESA|nr:hypothetical protein LWI29_018961 [Acer saccharum]